ncbi:putative nuclease HARBI1 isoform X1 [Centruroides sculpturatus]|uniref:putative nuclease HARBI1 isoform X1 n=1 Tax=Centruroides sculpturatus TaxID=218467 RepID=UPI000C6EFCC5|nr:putative nuclease HARBI1 isoform X1 [Centruroides sculpturatus]
MASFGVRMILLREQLEREEIRIRHRESQFNLRADAFRLNDTRFKQLYRLPKPLVIYVCNALRDTLEPKCFKKNALSAEIKVLCALRFFASGSYQMPVAQDSTLEISQPSVSRCITAVSKAINIILLHHWIKFPTSETEMALVKQKFMSLGGFPGVIGAIDGTHIPIIAPSLNDPDHKEFTYINRKGYHSINTQIVCDPDMKIISVNAKFPGSTHDSFIWKSCNLRRAFIEGRIQTNNNAWLIGDSGYPMEPWLLTPILDAQQQNEQKYNSSLISTRIIVERCNGLLKSRFRCLHKHRVLNYSPYKAGLIINACAVLHNMCIVHKISLDENIELYDGMMGEMEHTVSRLGDDVSLGNKGREIQKRLLRSHFM